MAVFVLPSIAVGKVLETVASLLKFFLRKLFLTLATICLVSEYVVYLSAFSTRTLEASKNHLACCLTQWKDTAGMQFDSNSQEVPESR